MLPKSRQPPSEPRLLAEYFRGAEGTWRIALLCGAALAVFVAYASVPLGKRSAFSWAWLACNRETDYLHGRLVPLAIGVLIFLRRGQLAAARVVPNSAGLIAVALAVLCYVLAARTMQPRLALGALPVLLLGSTLFLWGMPATKLLAFPIALIYFAIPIPGLVQATTHLQIVTTQTSYHLTTLLGAKVSAAGNFINAADGSWGFDIAEGCSGIRSLIALTLIAAVYGEFTLRRWWQKLALLAASLPVALLANGVRVSTVVLIAEYGSPEFAARAYHSFSGLLFVPVGILGIAIAAALLKRCARREPGPARELDAPAARALGRGGALPRLVLLNAGLFAGLLTVLLLPRSFAMRDSAVIPVLPERAGTWTRHTVETADNVLRTLGSGTEFSEAIYFRQVSRPDTAPAFQRIGMFIVLAGDDVNAGIHRPERCFPALGFSIDDRRVHRIAAAHGPLEVTRLESTLRVDGAARFRRLAYYWFVGNHEISHGHYGRTWIDIRDRLLTGQNQRWAYVMVSADFDYAETPEKIAAMGEAEVEAMLDRFVSDIFPAVHRLDMIR